MDTHRQDRWTQHDVALAVRRNEFIPFFQPQIDLATGRVSCVEMLARWNHPRLGILPPSQFIEVVENAGLIDQFTDNLLRQSLVRAAIDAIAGRKIGMAINFSLLTLQDRQAPHRIFSMVKEYGVSPDQITLEVTERFMPEDLSPVIEALTFLRSQGFRISIDDFGTGYSSLKLLSRIPFTELKIDQMFVAGVPEDRKLTGIVESIVDLAENLALHTVAEGIETEAQLEFVQALGCNVGQGFDWGRPESGIEAGSAMEETRFALA